MKLETSSIKLAIILLVILFGCTQKEETITKPNILFILADDLGYGDLGCYGSQSIETPYLDNLAQQGMRFTRFYAASAVCTPSRACLLTGKFPLRYDIREHFKDSVGYLVQESIALSEILNKEGYATAHIGKWHLGGLRTTDIDRRQAGKPALPGPLQHGFDYYLADIEGPIRQHLLRTRKLYREGGKYMIENDKLLPENKKHWESLDAVGLVRM